MAKNKDHDTLLKDLKEKIINDNYEDFKKAFDRIEKENEVVNEIGQK